VSACPVCGKPVDPLRAPAVAVVGGKIVSFCSKEHAASSTSATSATSATDSRPARKDATPAKRKDATPVP
jgi:YHS domain-containing protein